MRKGIISFSLRYPEFVFAAVFAITLFLVWQIPKIKVDTDPENMLSEQQEDRVLHNQIKKRFNLSDSIVVGLVNEGKDGVFNPDSLSLLRHLTSRIISIKSVVAPDVMSVSTVDNITQEGEGVIRFQWMMQTPPTGLEQAQQIKQAVLNLPLLKNTLVSEDGKATAIYVPLTDKHESHRVATEIKQIIADLKPAPDDKLYITGLPVAEDTFGVEMFTQMSISAPLAGLVIFILMWFFFRSVTLISAPMIMAVVTVVCTMGVLIGLGYTVHIMSSMIPIFLMPIAVLDSVHILSEFSDRYRDGDDPSQVVEEVMSHLFTPMLYTSLTSAVGFASLAFTPIPPVKVFGIFVAGGILLAFFLTITFIPAFIVSLSQRRLKVLADAAASAEGSNVGLAKLLPRIGFGVINIPKTIVLLVAAICVISIFGITRIQINDNPVRWFKQQHEIRIADKVLNKHFAGTYNAFLVLNNESNDEVYDDFLLAADQIVEKAKPAVDISQDWGNLKHNLSGKSALEQLEEMTAIVDDLIFESEEPEEKVWQQILDRAEDTYKVVKYFQLPESIKLLEDLQSTLMQSGLVGKTNSFADLVKTVYRELKGGKPMNYQIPDSSAAVAQTVLSFQSSHRPNDLWHMVTPDYGSAAIWIQLKSGDNVDMDAVIKSVDDYLKNNPLPKGVKLEWGGLTYINVIWQGEMVNGMVMSLLGSFIIVLLMMMMLFRSIKFGLLAMIPLSVTITFIYGVIGLVGKNYDMPVAVLSSLTLGLSVDFAIHYIQRMRDINANTNDWNETIGKLYAEPARAISRNAIVIAVGFTPLLLAPLVPYITVGFFLASIMAISSVVTLFILPAIVVIFRNKILATMSLAETDVDEAASQLVDFQESDNDKTSDREDV
ncbi:MAG: RND transporter [Gammaproteobacteria bacterium]|nr:MAG: RND transporter [Gammaproteobacteria bacterium]